MMTSGMGGGVAVGQGSNQYRQPQRVFNPNQLGLQQSPNELQDFNPDYGIEFEDMQLDEAGITSELIKLTQAATDMQKAAYMASGGTVNLKDPSTWRAGTTDAADAAKLRAAEDEIRRQAEAARQGYENLKFMRAEEAAGRAYQHSPYGPGYLDAQQMDQNAFFTNSKIVDDWNSTATRTPATADEKALLDQRYSEVVGYFNAMAANGQMSPERAKFEIERLRPVRDFAEPGEDPLLQNKKDLYDAKVAREKALAAKAYMDGKSGQDRVNLSEGLAAILPVLDGNKYQAGQPMPLGVLAGSSLYENEKYMIAGIRQGQVPGSGELLFRDPLAPNLVDMDPGEKDALQEEYKKALRKFGKSSGVQVYSDGTIGIPFQQDDMLTVYRATLSPADFKAFKQRLENDPRGLLVNGRLTVGSLSKYSGKNLLAGERPEGYSIKSAVSGTGPGVYQYPSESISEDDALDYILNLD